MKIHYISGSSFPSEVSHTLSKIRMCQAFTEAGHEVILTGINSDHKKTPNEFYSLKGDFKISLQKMSFFLNNYITRKLRIRNLFNGIFQLKKTIQFRPDIIYSRLTVLELFFVPRNIPIIYEMHSLGPFGKGIFYKTLFKILLRIKNFKRIIVSSEALKKILKNHINNIEVVIARLSAEEPIKITKQELERFKLNNLKGANFKYHVGYTGYLDTVGLRGTDLICKIASQSSNIAFHIVGGKLEIVEHWVDYAKDWNYNNNIYFYGHKNPKLIPFFLNLFDVVLAPLQLKPEARAPLGANMSPLKIPQYMAYKKAIIVSDLNAHREILEDNKTAFIVNHSNVSKWVEKIRVLLDSKIMREKMGEACFKEYTENYTPIGRVKKILHEININ